MTCPQCHADNPPTAKFCAECGARLRLACPNCGAEAPPAAKFCAECGTALASAAAVPPPAADLEAQFATLRETLPAAFRDQLLAPAEGENRVVTVLFADMSGSVATVRDLHPEEGADLVNRLLRAIVDVLLKYEGRVDRFLGDGVLAVFGAPRAHESDPERAILAALEIREAARQQGMEVTAGINTGEVYVGRMGSERHVEQTVMGPVVNLASRLQAHAEPGQILVGEATYHQTRRAFAFTPLSIPLKGFTELVVAHAVERPLPRPEKARGIEGLRAELIGRDEELSKLKDALADVCRGHGRIVSLIGEAGVGKSRLVAELKAGVTSPPAPPRSGEGSWIWNQTRSDPVHSPSPLRGGGQGERSAALWLEGRCLELGMSASYWLFVDLFRDYFARLGEDERGQAERLAAALREFVESGDLTSERLDEMGPLLGNLLSLRFGNDWDERLKHASPEQIRHQTFLAVHDFFVALARRRPVVLVLEDLHWADSLSLDLISLLMEALRLAPLLLLCVYRPEQEHKCWHLATIAQRKCPERFTEVRLHELTPQQGRRLVESLLTIENLPEAVKELILSKAHGNPFFVEEVIRSLIASGMVYHEGEVWHAKEGIESIAVPESVRSVILTRVDRLDRELKRVLQNAAVIGRLFRQRLLEQTLGKAGELERDLWELEEKAFIYQERAVPEAEYSFQHVLMQETVYGNILRRRRAAFHQQVGEAIETLYADGLAEHFEELAYHYERSSVDEKAIEYLLKAGEKARRAYLNEEAIGYFQRALERLERSEPREGRTDSRLAALRGLGRIYFGLGQYTEAEIPLREAIALGRERALPPRELVRLYYWLGEVLAWLRRYDEMQHLAGEGLALLGTERESVEVALMNAHVAFSHLEKGDRQKWREFTTRNMQFLEHLPYSEELRPAYDHIACFCFWDERNLDEALRWLQALARRAEAHHDLNALSEAHREAGTCLAVSGDTQAAIDRLQRALELSLQTGGGFWKVQALSGLTQAFLTLGDLPRAQEHARASLEAAEAGQPGDTARAHVQIGGIALCQESRERAVEAFRKAAQLYREADSPAGEAWATCLLGRVSMLAGNPSEARARFQDVLARAATGPWTRRQALSWLEESWEDPEAFRAFCGRVRADLLDTQGAPASQWFLESARPRDFSQRQVHEAFDAPLSSEWKWQDPYEDCSLAVQTGLELYAANGRNLWRMNQSAPRLIRPVAGEFAVQTLCLPVSTERPAMGGLLIWKDRDNFLHLDRGVHGMHETSFAGYIGNREVMIGRGRLPAERVFLRLERIGSRVNALCSADGESWFTVGHVEFPVEDPVQVGLHAIGMIDRTIYPGAYPDGTAIRFESFTLCGGE
jgi:class 3 adenylate cyclase/tetratricopeptide (TPR) repeat protein